MISNLTSFAARKGLKLGFLSDSMLRAGTCSQQTAPFSLMAQGLSLGLVTLRRSANPTRRHFTTIGDPQKNQKVGGGGWKAAWDGFLAPKELPPRNSLAWYKEMLLICTVFAVTGTSTMVLVRPAVSNGLGIRGSLKDGPWSYRICSLIIMSPIYGVLLVIVGTAFGRHAYFRHFSVKMFSRFGIPPELLDPTFHQTKKTFRKW